MWDAVIVGAGPAGSAIAVSLASLGHKILLIDKEDFPREKVCGDALISDSINALKRLGFYEKVLEVGHVSHLSSVFSPSQIQFDVPGEFLTLKRFLLDDLMVKRSRDCGAQFLQAKVVHVETQPDHSALLWIREKDQPIHSKIVFLSTGADIQLPLKLGLVSQSQPSALALRCYIRSRFEVNSLIFSYDRSIIPGYGWIFPLGGGEYNVGVGMRYNKERKLQSNLREVFQAFTKKFPIAIELFRQADSILPLRSASLRCGLAGTSPIGSGNLLLVGETISSTFPFSGEGIGKAMETGELAAKLAHQGLTSGDLSILQEYPHMLEQNLRLKFLGYQIAENWLSQPWLNDFFARRIRKSTYLKNAVAGILNETVNPKDIFSWRGLIQSFLN